MWDGPHCPPYNLTDKKGGLLPDTWWWSYTYTVIVVFGG